MTIEIFAYKDTSSMAGLPKRYNIDPLTVISAYCWVNSYGNPSYTLYADNEFYYLVDSYGAMNGINHISAISVRRKKDLF